jgi:hypothetical protein
LLLAVLVYVGFNAYQQALREFRDVEPGSLAICALQTLVGSLALLAAAGVWRRASWTTRALGGYGAATAGMLVLLGPILRMSADERVGLWQGAGAVLAGVALMMWYWHRSLARIRRVDAELAAGLTVPSSPPVAPDATAHSR